jgi:hypothetical protein
MWVLPCKICLASFFLGVCHLFLLHLSSDCLCQSSSCCHVSERITYRPVSILASSIVAESAAREGVLHSLREAKWWGREKKICFVVWKTTGQALSSALNLQHIYLAGIMRLLNHSPAFWAGRRSSKPFIDVINGSVAKTYKKTVSKYFL